MFQACLHCHAPLGSNEAIEEFQTGRRLAFDAAQGRLWLVCTKCRRWNLSPIEERWEAVEACIRAFEKTRLRVASDNIALARTSEGLDLVRVGGAGFTELSAWRYGRSLQHRWRTRGLPWTMLGFSGAAGQFLFQTGMVGVVGFAGIIGAAVIPAVYLTRRLARVRIPLADGRVVTVKHLDNAALTLEPDPQHGWALRITTPDAAPVRATGTTATHGLRGVLTAVNFFGATGGEVKDAITRLEEAGDSRRFIERVATVGRRHGAASVSILPPEVRLALEMALHEDVERAAMEGELALLRDEWRLAEEVARIADDLLLPTSVGAALQRLKGMTR